MSGIKLSLLTRNGPIWRNLRMQGEFYTAFTTKKPSRENFVPNTRQKSSEPTQQHTRPHRSGGRRRVRRNRRARPRCRLPVGRASMGWQDHRHTNFACNSIDPNFNKRRKRCNSNDANSMFEQAAGELHAKLLCRQARPRGRQAPAGPPGGGGAWPGFETRHRDHPTHISHIISLGHFLRPPKNVAIPTT